MRFALLGVSGHKNGFFRLFAHVSHMVKNENFFIQILFQIRIQRKISKITYSDSGGSYWKPQLILNVSSLNPGCIK